MPEQWVRFFSSVDLVNSPEEEKTQVPDGKLALSLMRVDLVMLDEFGYLLFIQAGEHCSFTCFISPSLAFWPLDSAETPYIPALSEGLPKPDQSLSGRRL